MTKWPLVFAVMALFTFATGVQAGELQKLTPEDYRLFCGYMDALDNPKVAKLKGKKRDRKIAKMAKMRVKKLMKSVNKVKEHGATCDEVGKMFEGKSKKAVEAALPGRVDLYYFDASDPSHVVASVRWTGGDRKKLVQEAALLAKAVSESASIVKTIAIRGVDPRSEDRASDAAIWFEATMTASRANNIDKGKIKDYADRRYIRLFDGVKCADAIAAPTQLGYRGGPCERKE